MQNTSKFIVAALSFAVLANAANAADPSLSPPEANMVFNHANGSFDVQTTPQVLSSVAADSGLARMSIDKRFHGSLQATSTGEMLAFRSGVDGSAGYVAMEMVRGSLDGRSGSFVLQHSSTMTRGVAAQSITVVPDSGTDALAGLSGRMIIDIATDGSHSYRFEFTLPETAP